MTLISPTYRTLLRGIALVYLVILVTALISSGYLLSETLSLKPIPLIGLLKYLLLCVLFLILGFNTIKVFALYPRSVTRFYHSTTNFKWLFTIAVVISVLAKLGIFDTALHKQRAVGDMQMMILFLLGIFCFWSDGILKKAVIISEQQDIKKDQLK